ncbi:MAG: hypothetical protein ACK5V3_01065 [Bdellovibrionales bacterium]
MIKLSSLAGVFMVGESSFGQIPAGPQFHPCQIDTLNGVVTLAPAPLDDIVLGTRVFPAAPVPAGEFRAAKVWGAVWNDYADFQKLNDKLVYGKVYYDTIEGAKICTQRCQMGIMGVATNTFGAAVGQGANYGFEVPIAVAGWVLAYVDKEYPTGTPLTNDESGNLTEMTLEEKRNYPERLIATYKKKELDIEWGMEGKKVAVDGRHWVQVK